jgi:hypothetical protein
MSAATEPNGHPSRDARRLAAVLLEVLAGMRSPPQAAEALGISLPRYYQLEDRGVAGLVAACEARPRGRAANPLARAGQVQKENERLKKDLGRYQSLVRLTQRTIGVAPPAPAKGPPKRKRTPAVRAMRRVERLRTEANGSADAEASAARTESGS